MKHTEGDDKDNSTYLTASHCHSVDKGESLYIINSGLETGATIYSLCPTLTGGKLDWGGKLYISCPDLLLLLLPIPNMIWLLSSLYCPPCRGRVTLEQTETVIG